MDLPVPPDPGLRRRIIFFVVGSLVAVLALAAFVYFKDEALEDHSDLVPKLERSVGGAAAFMAWLAAAAAVDASAWDGPRVDFTEMVEGSQPWDAGAATEMLAAQREALALAVRADALGTFQTPRMTNVEETGIDTGAILRVVRILLLASLERAQAGDVASAVERARVGLRFGDHFVLGSNSFVAYLVACLSQQLALSTINRLSGMGLDDPGLVALMTSLGNEPDQSNAFRETVRAEFNVLGNALDHRDEFEGWGTLPDDPPPAILFKRNATLNEAAVLYRRLIAEAAKQPDQRSLPAPRVVPTGLARYSANAYGKYLNAGPDLSEMLLNLADHATAHRRLLRVKLALLRHENATGNLPATLDELVPAYLDAIPADPYDGKPVRYDATRGLVWVLGKGLIDGGCAEAPENGCRSKDPDPALLIHPAPPEGED